MTPDQWIAFFVIIGMQVFAIFCMIWIGFYLKNLINSKFE